MYSPVTIQLKSIEEKLGVLELPIFFSLPSPEVLEPFVVIGSSSSDTWRTAQTGAIIEDSEVSVDIFLPRDSRTRVEEVKSQALRALGRPQRLMATVLVDDSIGREVYHIAIQMTETII